MNKIIKSCLLLGILVPTIMFASSYKCQYKFVLFVKNKNVQLFN